MENKLVIAVAAALFSVPASAFEAPQETQVFVTVSMPKDTAPAFRKYLEDPSRRAALEACKETTTDIEKLNPNFPRPLKRKDRKLFERLLFACDKPGPDVFASFGAASREAALATDAPMASIRLVLDTIPATGTRLSSSSASAKALGAPRAAAAACTLQRCYSGDLRRVNNFWACTCQ